LILACNSNNISLVELLLEYYTKNKSTVDINQINSRGEHLLHVVCSNPDVEDDILKLLLNFPGISVDESEMHNQNTPLHFFASKNRSLKCEEIGQLFIDSGARVNAINSEKETPLHKAMFNEITRAMMVKMLLKNKKARDAVNIQSVTGDTPLLYAIQN